MKNTILVNGKRYVCKVYDTPEFFDRYTAVFKARKGTRGLYWPYLGMSENPFNPLGFGQHGELTEPPASHLGKRVDFDKLPEDVKKCIIQELTA